MYVEQEPEAFEVYNGCWRGSMLAVDRDALCEVVSQSMDGSCMCVGNVQSRSKGWKWKICYSSAGVFQPENCICAVKLMMLGRQG